MQPCARFGTLPAPCLRSICGQAGLIMQFLQQPLDTRTASRSLSRAYPCFSKVGIPTPRLIAATMDLAALPPLGWMFLPWAIPIEIPDENENK